jgi:hypothetical protein
MTNLRQLNASPSERTGWLNEPRTANAIAAPSADSSRRHTLRDLRTPSRISLDRSGALI